MVGEFMICSSSPEKKEEKKSYLLYRSIHAEAFRPFALLVSGYKYLTNPLKVRRKSKSRMMAASLDNSQ